MCAAAVVGVHPSIHPQPAERQRYYNIAGGYATRRDDNKATDTNTEYMDLFRKIYIKQDNVKQHSHRYNYSEVASDSV